MPACTIGVKLATNVHQDRRELISLARRASTGRYGPSQETIDRMAKMKQSKAENLAELEAHQVDCVGCRKLDAGR